MRNGLLKTLMILAGAGSLMAQTITSFNPTTAAAGGNQFTLTVLGSNLNAVSQVSWTSPGVPTPTILQINPSSNTGSQFTVDIPANLIANPGNATIQACQTTPSFSCSPAVTFPIRPKPVLTGTTPASTVVGSGITSLTLNGTNLTTLDRAVIANTTVAGTVNGAGTQFTFTLPQGLTNTAGSYPVYTQDSVAGATSNAVNFTVGIQLTSVAPTSTLAGSPQPLTVTLTAPGGLGPNTQYFWNGSTPLTPVGSPDELGTTMQVQIPAALISAPTTGTITAVSGGQTSNGVQFTALGPTTTSLSQSSVTAGSAALPLTINGANFGTPNFGSPQVIFTYGTIATSLTPTSSTGSVVTVTIPANLLSQPGNATIAVKNFAANNGPSSNSQPFTIYATPVLTSVTPSTVPYNTATQITVNGTFNAGDQLIFNGTTLPTTGSTSALQATVPANLMTLGPKPVQAVNTFGTKSVSSVTVNVIPVITSLNPTGVAAGSGSFPLTVNVSGGLNAPSGPVGFNTNSSTLSCNGVEGCVQNTPTSVTLGGFTLTYNPGSGAGLLPPSIISLGNITTTGSGTSAITGILLTINVTSTPPGTSGSLPSGTITGIISTGNSGANITFSPSNTTTGFGALPGVIIGVGTPSYTYQILNPTLVIQSPTSGNPPGQTLIQGGVSDANSVVVSFNGNNLPAGIISGTQARVTIPGNLVQTPGVVPVTIATGGAVSAPANFTISSVPVTPPTVSQVTPNVATAGDPATSVTITGTNFKPDNPSLEYTGSRVLFTPPGGSQVQLTPSSAQGTTLVVTIPQAQLATAGAATIAVTNLSDETTSGTLAFTIRPRLALSSLSPNPTGAGASTTLTVLGSNFASGDTLLIGSPTCTNVNCLQALSTIVASANTLTGSLPGSLIPAIGTYTVYARNSLGALSQPLLLTTTLVITSLSPPSVSAGGPAFNLTATLTGGVTQGAVLNYRGTQLTTVSFTPTSITAAVPASLITTPGTPPVYAIFGESQSNTVNHLVVTSLTLSSISPSSVDAGTNGLTLFLTGTGFDSGSTATFNGNAIPTTFVNANSLTAQVAANLLATAQTASIGVTDSQHRTSNTQTLSVVAPLTLRSLSPSQAITGSPQLILTVNGTGFDPSTVIFFSLDETSASLATTYVSPTVVTAIIPAQYLTTPGIALIGAFDGRERSAPTSLPFVIGPAAIITNLNPSSATINTTVNMTITGSGFTPVVTNRNTPAPQVLFGTTSIPATLVSDTQITVIIPDSVNSIGGTIPVSVKLGDGRVTNSLPFNAISNPVITSVSPASVDVRSAGLTLTVTGLYFQTGAVIVVNGSPLPTTFISSTQLAGPLPQFTSQGSATVTVVNPGGLTSNSVGLGIGGAKPIPPTLSVISPASIAPGGPGFTLTASGSGFQSGAVINFGGTSLQTSFINTGQLTGQVPAGLVAQSGSITVYVANPDGTSTNSLTFVVSPASGKPIITSLTPSSTSAGAAAFTLGVSGSGFKSGATVSFGGISLPTTFISANQLTASVSAALVKTAGQVPVIVTNPEGVSSDPATFVVTGFSLISISPSSATAGGSGFTLTLTGTGFLSGASASFNGSGITTTFVNATTLTASVPASLIATAGIVPVTVTNPDGAVSGAVSFTIRGGITLISISPTTIPANSKATPITATGTGFVQGASIVFNGTPIPTTFGSATGLSGTIPPELLTQTGTFSVTVVNPNGDASNALSFIVGAALPPPVITSVSQNTASAGSPALTLTVTGSGFVQGSTVVFGGTNSATTFVSATELRAVVSVGQLSQGGLFTIVVNNPNGDQSNAVNFTVITPLSITSLSPTALPQGASSTTLVIAGAGIVSGATVQFGSTTLTPDSTSPTQVAVTLSAALLSQAGTVNVTVKNPDGTVSNALPFSVVPLPAISVNATITPAGTNQVVLTLANPAPADLSGTLVLSFTANALNTPANYVDPAVQFASGGTSISFTIPKGATTVTLPGNGIFSPGTVAGTLTLTLTRLIAGIDNVLPSPAPSRTFTIAGAAPTITANTVKIINGTSTGFTVEVIGFTTTRDIRSITLTFTTSQSVDGGGTFTIDLTNQFNSYFSSTTGLANGGTFKLDIPFTISGADANVVTAVTVTLSNSVGTSQPVSGGR